MSAHIPFDQIRDVSLAQADRLLRDWFPNGRIVGREFKIGNIAGDRGESLSINLNTGRGADFAGNDRFADLIDVRAAMKHGGDRTAAARELGPMLGITMNGRDAGAKAPGSQKKRDKAADDWRPIVRRQPAPNRQTRASSPATITFMTIWTPAAVCCSTSDDARPGTAKASSSIRWFMAS
jgi:putative DNA primase/helicase